MAEHANIMPFNPVAITGSASTQIKTVANIASCLAALMADVHGWEWKVIIDHENEFILIRPRYKKPIAKPHAGRVV